MGRSVVFSSTVARLAALTIVFGGGCRVETPTGPAFTALDAEHHFHFPITSSTPHAVDCNRCHGAFESFAQFSCLDGCHDEAETSANHSGMGGYSYDSERCLECHPSGTAAGSIDHGPVFPIDPTAVHGGLACTDCHANPDWANVVCAGACHPTSSSATSHNNVGGYQWSTPLCLRCHADSQVDPVNSHLPFRISSGEHRRESCFGCHPAARPDKPFNATDFSTFACRGCHDDNEMLDKHSGMSRFSLAPTSCVQSGCHADGDKP